MPDRPNLATTFRPDEVAAACKLLEGLLRGADVRQLVRSEPVRSLHGKFVRMRDRLSATEAERG